VLVSRVEARVADLRTQVQRRGLFGR
jgi:hypothetical protein